MATVYVFVASDRFGSIAAMRQFTAPTCDDDGELMQSEFGFEVGLENETPRSIEHVYQPEAMPLAELLRVRDSAQWIDLLDSSIRASEAICVYSPNTVTRPDDSSMRFCGAFAYQVTTDADLSFVRHAQLQRHLRKVREPPPTEVVGVSIDASERLTNILVVLAVAGIGYLMAVTDRSSGLLGGLGVTAIGVAALALPYFLLRRKKNVLVERRAAHVSVFRLRGPHPATFDTRDDTLRIQIKDLPRSVTIRTPFDPAHLGPALHIALLSRGLHARLRRSSDVVLANGTLQLPETVSAETLDAWIRFGQVLGTDPVAPLFEIARSRDLGDAACATAALLHAAERLTHVPHRHLLGIVKAVMAGDAQTLNRVSDLEQAEILEGLARSGTCDRALLGKLCDARIDPLLRTERGAIQALRLKIALGMPIDDDVPRLEELAGPMTLLWLDTEPLPRQYDGQVVQIRQASAATGGGTLAITEGDSAGGLSTL